MEDDDSSSDQPGYISPSYTDYFIAGCRRIRPCNEIDWRKDTEVESDEAKSFVKKAYDDGVPLFTKSALREIQKQLKGDLRAGQKVSIKSIDGVPVEFDVKTGEVVLSGINSEYVASLASILADRDDIDIGSLRCLLGSKVERKVLVSTSNVTHATSVDSKVLGEAGITIVADLEGFLQVDDAAVVVSLYPNAPVKQVVADISRPAVIIWDVFTDDGDGLTDPVSSRVEAFMQGFYQAYEFPSDDDNMRNIAVFTRFDI
ncbi:hypothetical protein A7C99_0039 [Trichophyton rubrum]|uniref:Uncharacterized protein n=1 Tax=Trichophyton rubrum TaxID=5551 RepID=A0A178F935_TRIRU|nr:hypothetical protein A7C99_0039 [Trichophyton rubrum]